MQVSLDFKGLVEKTEDSQIIFYLPTLIMEQFVMKISVNKLNPEKIIKFETV
jgi:hypothetical protein